MAASFWAACAILSDSIPWVGSICCCSFAKKLTSSDPTNFDGPPNRNVPLSAARVANDNGLVTILILH
jgi:hypothetical protein